MGKAVKYEIVPPSGGSSDVATPVQEQTQAQAPKPGMLSRAWNAVNTPLLRTDADDQRTASSRAALASPPTDFEVNHPILSGIGRGAAGAGLDTIDTIKSFTSPLAIATMGLGAAGKAPGAVGKIANVGMKLMGAGFAAKGGADVADAATNSEMSTPDRWQKGLQGGGMMAGGVAGAVPRTAPFAGKYAAAMNEKAYGQQHTPAELSLFAKSEGIPLDASQVTQSPALKTAADVAKKSFSGAGTMDRAATAQKTALSGSISRMMDSMAPDYGIEGAGSRITGQLADAEGGVKADAQQLYNHLHEQTKGKYGVAYEDVSPAAQKLVDQYGSYYKSNPQFKPKFWDVVTDLAGRNKPAPAPVTSTAPGLEVFRPDSTPTPKPSFMPFGDAQMLRSDLLEFARNNPDTIKSRPQAWADVLSPAVDNAMMKAGGGLPPDLQDIFRTANSKWTEAKQFDNNRSALYNPVRQIDTSKTGNSLFSKGNQTAQTARNLNQYMGDDSGVAQREQLRRLTDPNNSGTIDLGNLHKRIGSVPNEYLNQLYGPDSAGKILKYGDLAHMITEERNPSGTARVAQGMTDVRALTAAAGYGIGSGNPLPLIGAGAGVAAPYGMAKLLNSPKVSDYLTTTPKPMSGNPLYGSIAAAVAARKRQPKR